MLLVVIDGDKKEETVRNHDFHNGMILSTLSINSHGLIPLEIVLNNPPLNRGLTVFSGALE